ncbi:MAG: sensor histidine kinase, partial [Cohnella sp.]|nr:sensor histidine kinase [Cohnella sp.]
VYDFDATGFENETWYLQTLAKKGGIAIFGSHMPFHRVGAAEPVISIARAINKVGTRDLLGVMLIDIRLDSLKNILSLSENSNRSFVITDQKGGIIYSSDPDTTDVNASGAYVNFVSSPYSQWKVYQIISEEEMTKDAKFLRKIILALALFSLIMAVLSMYILHRRVTKPIVLLSRQVKQFGMGNFEVDLSSKRRDEFGVLYQGVRKMVEDLQSYIERTSITKAQQKVAQYGALKSQINPHFLANALESVQMKAVIGGQREIGEMIGRLGRLFRIHIRTGKETVPLEEELAHTRLYIEVQQMRFGDKIRYAEEIAAGSESVQMLHFSLQPLIENAIVHGLERRTDTGVLTVTTSYDRDDLLIVVKDNGVGMDSEKLQEIREHLEKTSDTLGEAHIGVKNVHERIQYYFGEQYGLRIDSEPGAGTEVTIRIPALKKGND